MTRFRASLAAVCGSVWWLALVAWVAAIIAPAAAAMVAFPTLPELDVAIPSTRDFFAGDVEAAGRFVAGYVTNPIFLAADSVRLATALVIWTAVLVFRGRPLGGGRLSLVAVLAIAIATVLLVTSLTTVAGPLAESLDAWRVAVLDGDHDAAAQAKAAFDPLHEQASTLMSSELLCVLVAIALSGAASVRPSVTGSASASSSKSNAEARS